MGYMATDAAQRLHQLIATSHVREYSHNARFRATIDAALHGSTNDDVMALLVRGLADSCNDTETMRGELKRTIERTPMPNRYLIAPNPQASGLEVEGRSV